MSDDNVTCSTCHDIDCPGAPRFKGLCAAVKTQRPMSLEHFLRLRGVETPCTKCHGFGVRTYGSTATWHGGMGGAAMTQDVCDHCWGSGDEHRHWANLRMIRNREDQRVAERAATFLAKRCGQGLTTLIPAMEELATELQAFEKQRRPRPQGFDAVSRSLARALKDMAEATKKDLEALKEKAKKR